MSYARSLDLAKVMKNLFFISKECERLRLRSGQSLDLACEGFLGGGAATGCRRRGMLGLKI